MRRFRIALFILTSISHGVLALGLASALGYAGAPHAGWLALAASLALTAPIGGRLASARRDRPIPLWRIVLVEELYHAHWCAAAGACPAFLAAALGLAVHAIFAGPAGLGARLGAAALASYLCALLVALYAVFVRRRWVRVRTIDIPVAGLGAGFEGYRIAHLSDLHIGYLWPRPRAERWIARLRDIDADLVALTGDYVASSTAFHLDIAEVLGAMRGRDGAFAVMGNHDYFAGGGEHLVRVLRARGVTVLRNEHSTLSRGGASLTIAGVDDTWSGRASPGRALEGCPAGAPVIALAHDPQLFPELARGGAALTLSGHTHWGQIAVPFLAARYNLSRFAYRYHAGLYRIGAATLYVNPGLGTTGPPLRLGAPPEITVLRLRRAGQQPP
jgi:predicted MPP superfamily phosphohydrolase